MVTSTERLQLMCMDVLSGYDNVSYPFSKGNISALNTLKTGDFTGLFQVLGEENATQSDIMETGQIFFAAMSLGTTLSLLIDSG